MNTHFTQLMFSCNIFAFYFSVTRNNTIFIFHITVLFFSLNGLEIAHFLNEKCLPSFFDVEAKHDPDLFSLCEIQPLLKCT